MAPSEQEAASSRWVSALRDMVDGIGASETRIDRLIQRGVRGRTMSQSELLSMQAMVYRYSQQLDVISKLTEAVSSSARQMLNIQV
jgi:hypothetical protein